MQQRTRNRGKPKYVVESFNVFVLYVKTALDSVYFTELRLEDEEGRGREGIPGIRGYVESAKMRLREQVRDS